MSLVEDRRALRGDVIKSTISWPYKWAGWSPRLLVTSSDLGREETASERDLAAISMTLESRPYPLL